MYIINCVMSSNVTSSIFNDIISYFREYSNYKYVQTIRPLQNASLYFYFRPHLEKKLKLNSIVTVHHDLSDTDPNLNINLFIERYREAKTVVCLNTEQQELLKKYQIFNTVVIPHGYNDEVLLKKEKTLKSERITLGFFSSYYPRLVKGEDYLIKLFKTLKDQNVRFILVGKKREILAEQLRDIGYECIVFEYTPYRLLARLYFHIDFLINTSKFEGGPASLPEALYTKTPIITKKVGMSHDVNSNLLYYLSGDLDNDVQLLKKLFSQRSLVLTEAIKTTPKGIFCWKEIIEKYDSEFEKILEFEQIKPISDVLWFIIYYIEVLKYKFQTIYIKKTLINNMKKLWNLILYYRILK